MRKRRKHDSSLELFLDTICNVFGGILFIAICIAIQIQHTEGVRTPQQSVSPQEISEALSKLEQISADIAAAQVLTETLQASMPKPKDPADQKRIDMFFQLTSMKGDAASKETRLLKQLLDLESEKQNQQEKIKQIETDLLQKKIGQQKLEQEIEQLQKQQQIKDTASKEQEHEINELRKQIAQKQNLLQNKNSNQPRNEVVYLPKLRDAGTKRPEYFVLRFNRFYKVGNRGDFNYSDNYLGVPKPNRGVFVDESVTTKTQILTLFANNSKTQDYLSVFVYGDSAEQWYLVRDLLISSGFEYELIPTQDNTVWSFGGSGGSAAVQ